MSDIVNVGISTVDIIARTIDEFPPPGGLRLFDSLTMTTGGNAMNCSVALAKMGVGCEAVIKVGRDPLGDFVVSEAKKYGIGTAGLIRHPDVHTSFTFAAVHGDGQRSFCHTMGANGTLRYDEINLDVIRRAKFCFVTGTMVMKTFDGVQTAKLLAEAQVAGVVTLLDTVYTDAVSQQGWRDVIDPCLPHLDYFIPSVPEARAITGQDSPAAMARYFQDRGCKRAVLKLDARGAFCRDENGHECRVPAYEVKEVVDTTGAGDCWAAGFLTGLSQGASIADAAALGNAVAAHGIQAPGASTGIVPLAKIHEYQKNARTRG